MKKNESKENHEQEIKIFLPSSDEVKSLRCFASFKAATERAKKEVQSGCRLENCVKIGNFTFFSFHFFHSFHFRRDYICPAVMAS